MSPVPKHSGNNADSACLSELYHLVSKRIGQLPAERLNWLKIKVFLLPVIYIGLYIGALFQSERLWLFYILYLLMGVMVVVIFVNLIHEACHGNIFKSTGKNRIVFYLFDFMGANSYIWQQRHLLLHHRYPNTSGWDADIDQKGPLSVFPHEPVKGYHRYQHFYVFLMYPLFMLNWLFVRDFRDFFSSARTIRKRIKIPANEFLLLILFKFLFIFMIVFVPWLFFGFTFIQGIAGLLILTFAGSILAMLVLLTPHINTGNEFPLTDEKGVLPASWLRHQLMCTNDISFSNWFTRNILGNFNYHVAHHVFPGISSVYAPEVTEVLRGYAASHNLPYKSLSIGVSFRMHYDLIRYNANRSRLINK